MSSLKTYGRLDDAEQARLEARRRTRKRVAIISVSSLVLVAIVVAAVVGTTTSSRHRSSGAGAGEVGQPMASSIKALCDVTLYKESCYASLPTAVNSTGDLTPEYLLGLSIQVALGAASKAAKYFSAALSSTAAAAGDKMTAAALANCRDLIDTAVDRLTDSASASGKPLGDAVDDLRTWLSAAGTCYDTCVEGLKESNNPNATETVGQTVLKNSTELTSNALAIVTWVSKVAGSLKLRRLLGSDEARDPPEWVHRRTLQESSASLRKKADFVVAQDGSSKYKTIGSALKKVKSKNKKRTVIYVKRGVYKENVRVEKKMWNVVMIGDGMNDTIVTGSLNVVDGTPTFSTATFAVFGKCFVGREMGFRNTAGAIKHQAVALMASADQVVFHRCRVDGFQDSLYAHSNRQFYRDCDVYGTVDFVFGNAAAVLQNCRILPRVPMAGQKNTLTAQGRTDPNQNTGLAFHNCSVAPFGDLSAVQTYLGRPWKNYSTTVFARSYLAGIVQPSGWLPWTGDSAPSTIYYVEFENFGPGSGTKNRVKWKGLRTKVSSKEVNKFSVGSFLQGKYWIPDTGVPNKPSI